MIFPVAAFFVLVVALSAAAYVRFSRRVCKPFKAPGYSRVSVFLDVVQFSLFVICFFSILPFCILLYLYDVSKRRINL